jgi:hypothetical protein
MKSEIIPLLSPLELHPNIKTDHLSLSHQFTKTPNSTKALGENFVFWCFGGILPLNRIASIII